MSWQLSVTIAGQQNRLAVELAVRTGGRIVTLPPVHLYGCLHVCKMITDVWHVEVGLLSYIRPLCRLSLLAPMESAGRVLLYSTFPKDK